MTDCERCGGVGFLHTGADTVAVCPDCNEYGRRLIVTPASAVPIRQGQWLWNDLVPLRKVSVIAGSPGLGKSLLTVKLASDVSRGRAPGDLFMDPASALIVSAEDDPNEDIVPRLVAAGADLDRVHLLDMRENGKPGIVSIPTDVPAIEQVMVQTGARLLVLDPILALLDLRFSSYREQHVRTALGPLKALAERTGAAVICVMHLNKGTHSDPLAKIAHSGGFVALARSVLAFGRDPRTPSVRFDADNTVVGETAEDDDDLRVLGSVKANNARTSALSLRIERLVVEDGALVSTARLVEVGAVALNVRDIFTASDPQDATAVDEAVMWLRYALADGPLPAKEVKKLAREAGIAERTLERAKAALRVKSARVGEAQTWTWLLPPELRSEGKDAKDATVKDDDNAKGATNDVGDVGDVDALGGGGVGGLDPDEDEDEDDSNAD
jgi:hypothetical protein